MFGRRQGAGMMFNLALDRIQSIESATGEKFIEDPKFNPETFFDNIIGVTKTINDRAQKVQIWAAPEAAPYIKTKPLHKSQMVLQVNEDGSAIFEIEVVLNFELEKDLLGFGDGIQVLAPRQLRMRIEKRLRTALERY